MSLASKISEKTDYLPQFLIPSVLTVVIQFSLISLLLRLPLRKDTIKLINSALLLEIFTLISASGLKFTLLRLILRKPTLIMLPRNKMIKLSHSTNGEHSDQPAIAIAILSQDYLLLIMLEQNMKLL